MVQEEVKFFNVKNTSVRLVHIGGVSILPEQVVPVIDDPKGINRDDVETSDFLEATDEEPTTAGVYTEKPVAKAKKGSAKSNTATGTGWTGK